ncbi:hypothetical protein EDC96DRAFT_237254 [Choanephora cucurbitarum]|nr:hypothetical protein EDC96DRAFT_237254 [Choanephora cucurbitarum]
MKLVSQDEVIAKEEVFEFDAIVDHRGEPNHREYKVRWKNYTAEDDSWLTADHFTDPLDIQKYWRRIKGAIPAEEKTLLQQLESKQIKQRTLNSSRHKGNMSRMTNAIHETAEQINDSSNVELHTAEDPIGTPYRKTSKRTKAVTNNPALQTFRRSTRSNAGRFLPQVDSTRFQK